MKDAVIKALRRGRRHEGDGVEGRKVTVRVIELDWVLEFERAENSGFCEG